jgi:hypothetical protein
MPIFRVVTEIESYVWAENDAQAVAVAEREEREIIGDTPFIEWDAHEVSNFGHIPKDWQDSCPYGNHGDKTVRELMKMTEEDIAERERQAKERAEWDAHPALML